MASKMKLQRKASLLALALALALAAGAAWAHGDKKHVVGTVEKVSGDSVTVKTADGKSVEVKLVAATTYVWHSGTADKAAKLADLHAGDRVVIHATPKGDTLEAAEVRFSSASAGTTGSKP